MSDEKLIDLFGLLVTLAGDEPRRGLWLALGEVYGLLKERGYEFKITG